MDKIKRQPFLISKGSMAIIETYSHPTRIIDELMYLWDDLNIDDGIDYKEQAGNLLKCLQENECLFFIYALRDACQEAIDKYLDEKVSE